MTTNIYDKFRSATNNVSAYAVLNSKREYIAKIVIKFPKDGAMRLTAFVHWFGVPMVSGTAGGYGYD